MGLFIAGTGNTLSALVEYYLGMHIGNATNFIESKEKLPWGLGKLKGGRTHFFWWVPAWCRVWDPK